MDEASVIGLLDCIKNQILTLRHDHGRLRRQIATDELRHVPSRKVLEVVCGLQFDLACAIRNFDLHMLMLEEST